MTTVQDVLRELERLAPASLMESWDNGGLICGSPNQQVHRILIALDPFLDVAEEAIQLGVDLILTHHPLIFQPVRSVTDQDPVGNVLWLLAGNKISAINAHTNLDMANGGVNDCLAQALGLSDVEIIHPAGTDPNGKPYGLLRSGTVPEQPLSKFLAHVKESLGCPGLRYADCGKPVRKVAVGGGACSGEMMEAIQSGCDTFVTSDIKYNGFRDAYDWGLNIIDAGHFYTENPVCKYLLIKIQQAFPDIPVSISQNHHDCMKFF